MDSAAWRVGDEDEPIVGVVGRDAADDDSSALESVLDATDTTTVSGTLEDVLAATPSVLVAEGENALSALARADAEVPVLPVGSVAGIDSVSHDRLPAAVEAALEGEAFLQPRSVLGVAHEGADERIERALFDVTLVTDEPARISEYGIRSRGESVATVRADGVVVATPAGSHGYASAVRAPHLSTHVDAVAVAPIGPFVTRTRRWILPDDDVVLTVERDEGDVTLVADERSVGAVSVGSRVSVSVDGTLSTLVVPDEALAET